MPFLASRVRLERSVGLVEGSVFVTALHGRGQTPRGSPQAPGSRRRARDRERDVGWLATFGEDDARRRRSRPYAQPRRRGRRQQVWRNAASKRLARRRRSLSSATLGSSGASRPINPPFAVAEEWLTPRPPGQCFQLLVEFEHISGGDGRPRRPSPIAEPLTRRCRPPIVTRPPASGVSIIPDTFAQNRLGASGRRHLRR